MRAHPLHARPYGDPILRFAIDQRAATAPP
jgi:hypothetical protein